MLKESSKSRVVFRTQASIYDEAFFANLLDGYFCIKSSIMDVQMSYI